MSAVASLGDNASAQLGGAVIVHTAPAGSAPTFELPAGADGPFKARFFVEKPDGSRSELPARTVVRPDPPNSPVLEGPDLPADSGGGTLKIEIYDTETNQKVKSASSPIGF